MLISANAQELQRVKQAIERLKENEPVQYQQFKNVINLTRQLQYSFQYLGCLIMNDDPREFEPRLQDGYVLSIYKNEIENLKQKQPIDAVQELLAAYKRVSYDHICKLVLGENVDMLAGPMVVK
ncbi:hypothetical protein SAMN04488072_104108 [Lentibacillus halodurans]|uniref:Uncharacterized protein n=1 Tax=Lentibacillus halodurans TaxID=237679 RepID=A0A1I0X2J2_9BACI|nr:hypothetical protein [Lentibacillus halodurans]SFA95205.1 hypothetical protein SAMN04488072_104108 [Lentibacillus halodurans]